MTATLATRRIPLSGTYNLRDVGGYPVGDRTTRWGALLRSDALHKVDQAGRDTLRELNLALVIDLREAQEAESAPNALDGVGHRSVHRPVYDAALDTHADGFGLGPLYRQMITDHAPALTAAVRLVAGAGRDPVLVHCTAASGSPPDWWWRWPWRRSVWTSVTSSRTTRSPRPCWPANGPPTMLAMGLRDDLDMTEMVCASPASLMRETLAQIRADHGDVHGFLRAHGGEPTPSCPC